MPPLYIPTCVYVYTPVPYYSKAIRTSRSSFSSLHIHTHGVGTYIYIYTYSTFFWFSNACEHKLRPVVCDLKHTRFSAVRFPSASCVVAVHDEYWCVSFSVANNTSVTEQKAVILKGIVESVITVRKQTKKKNVNFISFTQRFQYQAYKYYVIWNIGHRDIILLYIISEDIILL